MAKAAAVSKAVVLLLFTRCLLLLLQLWESVTVLCFVVRFWLLSFVYLLVSCDCCVALPRGAMGFSAVCDCGIS